MQLRDRLQTAFGSSRQNGRRQRGREASEALQELPGMRREETPSGPVFFTEERWSLTHRHGDYCLGEGLELGAEAWLRLLPDAPNASLRDAVFVDIETTGLSGGTGTLVFMIGVGVFESDEFVLRQYFLEDIAFEGAMLRRVVEALDSREVIVSFNGRRFDVPLLLTRLTLTRVKSPVLASHLDLLYPSRGYTGNDCGPVRSAHWRPVFLASSEKETSVVTWRRRSTWTTFGPGDVVTCEASSSITRWTSCLLYRW